MLYEIPRCFLLWPVHWSLINALRMKVRCSVSKIILEGEVIFIPEPLSVLQKGQAGLCWEKFSVAIISICCLHGQLDEPCLLRELGPEGNIFWKSVVDLPAICVEFLSVC